MVQFGKTVNWLLVAPIYLVFAAWVVADNKTHAFDRYFEVGEVIVPLTVSGDDFTFDVTAKVISPFIGSYKVVIRDARTDIAAREFPTSGEFPYTPKQNADGTYRPGYPGPVGLRWWAGIEGKDVEGFPKHDRPALVYIETCWTVHDRPFWLGDVTGCNRSNTFHIE